jgi:hypothetical protein
VPLASGPHRPNHICQVWLQFWITKSEDKIQMDLQVYKLIFVFLEFILELVNLAM